MAVTDGDHISTVKNFEGCFLGGMVESIIDRALYLVGDSVPFVMFLLIEIATYGGTDYLIGGLTRVSLRMVISGEMQFCL